jgi:hypothetical protein
LHDKFASINDDRCIDCPLLDDIPRIISSVPSALDPNTLLALASDPIIQQAILKLPSGHLLDLMAFLMVSLDFSGTRPKAKKA